MCLFMYDLVEKRQDRFNGDGMSLGIDAIKRVA